MCNKPSDNSVVTDDLSKYHRAMGMDEFKLRAAAGVLTQAVKKTMEVKGTATALKQASIEQRDSLEEFFYDADRLGTDPQGTKGLLDKKIADDAHRRSEYTAAVPHGGPKNRSVPKLSRSLEKSRMSDVTSHGKGSVDMEAHDRSSYLSKQPFPKMEAHDRSMNNTTVP